VTGWLGSVFVYDKDDQSLTTSGFICSFALMQKNQKIKAANKNELDLYQYKARPGDLAPLNLRFPHSQSELPGLAKY
jgi:hypothetical protein